MVEQKKKRSFLDWIYLILSWFFSILLVLAGFGFMSTSILSSFASFVMAITLFPPLTKLLKERINIKSLTGIKIAIIVICFLIIGLPSGINKTNTENNIPLIQQNNQVQEQHKILCGDGLCEGVENYKTCASDCPKPEDACPDLSILAKPESNFFDDTLYSLRWSEGKKVEGWELKGFLRSSVNCRKGEEVGENTNYYYCGKGSLDVINLVKQIIDSSGNIIRSYSTRAYVVYDSAFNYIKTVCK